MRLITWNVAGRVTAQPAQAQAILGAGADVVCLQEVTVRTAPLWAQALSAAGYTSHETALDGLPPKPTKRRLAVLTAARAPVERLPAPAVPWAERVLCCVVDGVEVINVHSPIRS